VIELVDDIEGDVSRSVIGSQNYQHSLNHGLSALQEPIIDDLPSVLSELQESTQLMQDQQENSSIACAPPRRRSSTCAASWSARTWPPPSTA